MNKIIIFLFLILGISGCTFYQIDSQDTTSDFYPPKTNIEDVEYVDNVSKPYVEIGIVTVTTERRQTLEDILPKLKQEAAILGADAIIDIKTDASGVWKKIKPNSLLSNGYIRVNVSAKAIVYK